MKKNLYLETLNELIGKESNELNELDALKILYSLSMTHPILTEECGNPIEQEAIMIRIFHCFTLLMGVLIDYEGGKENEK